MSYKKFAISFVLFFLVFNLLITSHPFLDFIAKNNRVSYFYLPLDWSQKVRFALVKYPIDTTVFIGSSRTAYGVDVGDNKHLVNLGLLGGSVSEMKKLTDMLIINNTNIKVFLEVNPMSLTKKHIASMDTDENSQIFELDFFEKIFISTYSEVPIFKYRQILSDFARSFFDLDRITNKDDPYLSQKSGVHAFEFKQVISDEYRGFIKSKIMTEEIYHTRRTDECYTMLRWNLSDQEDDLTYGVSVLGQIIENLQRRSVEVVLWIPPWINGGDYGYSNEQLDSLKRTLVNRFKLKILDFRAEEALNEPSDFADCIHPTEKLSQEVTKKITKF